MSRKPDEGGFGRFLYNSDTGEVLGRTGMSWFKIIVFYIFFYAGLAAFFGACLYIFYLTLDSENPKYKKDASLIGTNPGIGFRPQPDQEHNVDSTLIWVSSGDYKFWSDQLKVYTEQAERAKQKGGTDLLDCSFKTDVKALPKKACKIPTTEYGPCTVDTEFGYKAGEPCVLIKLNRIIEWEPKLLRKDKKDVVKDGNKKKPELDKDKFIDALKSHGTKGDVEEPALPPALIEMMRNQLEKESDPARQYDIARSVWTYCDGENPADKENIGQITYYPMAGIPSYYFPFNRQENYVSPYLMVQFNRVIPGVLINIECKAFAGNIYQDRVMRLGSVHFELMVEHAKLGTNKQ